MSHVNTIQRSTQTYTYDELQQAIMNGSIDSKSVKNVSVFTQSADSNACTDGKDDGKIGFCAAVGSTIKGAVKGVVNGIKGCFTGDDGKFSLGKTLKTALTGAACLIPGVGPVIATGLCAYGAVKGGVGIAKGVAAAANATTDAEKKAAFESIGANGVATAASVAGLKGSLNTVANQAGVPTGSLRTTVKNLAKTGEGGAIKNLASNITKGTKNYYGSKWSIAEGSTISKVGQVAKETVKDTAGNVVNAAKTVKDTVKDKTSKFANKKGKTTAPKTEAKTVKTEYTKGTDGKITQTKTETINIEEMTQADIAKLDSSYKIDWDNFTATRVTTNTGATAKIGNTINDIKTSATTFNKNAIANGYQGLSNSGNAKMAAWTIGATGISNSASNIENQIPNASLTMATVDSQTGYEYDLQDYSVTAPSDTNYSTLIRQQQYQL